MQATNEDNSNYGLSLLKATILPLGAGLVPVIGGLVMPSLAASAGLSGLFAFNVLQRGLEQIINYNALLDWNNWNSYEGIGMFALGIALAAGTQTFLNMILGQNVFHALAAQLLGAAVILGAVIIVAAFVACAYLYKDINVNNVQPNEIVSAPVLNR